MTDTTRRPSREALLALNTAHGQPIRMTTPGKVIEDRDGIPAWMTPPTTRSGRLHGITITRTELDATGLTADDVPNIRILDL